MEFYPWKYWEHLQNLAIAVETFGNIYLISLYEINYLGYSAQKVHISLCFQLTLCSPLSDPSFCVAHSLSFYRPHTAVSIGASGWIYEKPKWITFTKISPISEGRKRNKSKTFHGFDVIVNFISFCAAFERRFEKTTFSDERKQEKPSPTTNPRYFLEEALCARVLEQKFEIWQEK